MKIMKVPVVANGAQTEFYLNVGALAYYYVNHLGKVSIRLRGVDEELETDIGIDEFQNRMIAARILPVS